MAGYTSSDDGNVTGYHGSEDYWIIKLDSNGKLLWQKSLGGSNTEEAYSIEETHEGGYIAAGVSSSLDGDVSGNHGDGDYWIVKLTGTGDIQWQKSFGGSSFDGAYSIEATTDHGYIISGTSNSNDGDVTGNLGNIDLWIMKLGPDVLLPVELLNFSGEVNGKQNLLHWITATENNNTGFEVQRCNDGNNFSKIGFVNSKAINGNSNLKLNYDFSDIGFAASTNYYRLKQIDKDGKFTYSNIAVLKSINAIAEGSITVYPNPVTNTLNIKMGLANNSNLRLSITDISGRLILSKPVLANIGETIQLDVSDLSPGAYFIKLIGANGSQKAVNRFIKD